MNLSLFDLAFLAAINGGTSGDVVFIDLPPEYSFSLTTVEQGSYNLNIDPFLFNVAFVESATITPNDNQISFATAVDTGTHSLGIYSLHAAIDVDRSTYGLGYEPTKSRTAVDLGSHIHKPDSGKITTTIDTTSHQQKTEPLKQTADVNEGAHKRGSDYASERATINSGIQKQNDTKEPAKERVSVNSGTTRRQIDGGKERTSVNSGTTRRQIESGKNRASVNSGVTRLQIDSGKSRATINDSTMTSTDRGHSKSTAAVTTSIHLLTDRQTVTGRTTVDVSITTNRLGYAAPIQFSFKMDEGSYISADQFGDRFIKRDKFSLGIALSGSAYNLNTEVIDQTIAIDDSRTITELHVFDTIIGTDNGNHLIEDSIGYLNASFNTDEGAHNFALEKNVVEFSTDDGNHFIPEGREATMAFNTDDGQHATELPTITILQAVDESQHVAQPERSPMRKALDEALYSRDFVRVGLLYKALSDSLTQLFKQSGQLAVAMAEGVYYVFPTIRFDSDQYTFDNDVVTWDTGI